MHVDGNALTAWKSTRTILNREVYYRLSVLSTQFGSVFRHCDVCMNGARQGSQLAGNIILQLQGARVLRARTRVCGIFLAGAVLRMRARAVYLSAQLRAMHCACACACKFSPY